jgi:hypothetical protein
LEDAKSIVGAEDEQHHENLPYARKKGRNNLLDIILIK